MSNRRWVNRIGYELVSLNGSYFVACRGATWVSNSRDDDEIPLVPVAEVKDYDDAVRILRALRADLESFAAIRSTLGGQE